MNFGSHALRHIGLFFIVVTIMGAAAPAAPAGNPGTERLWLLGGLALSLTAAGVVGVVAARGRGRE
ncbi:hypothetical protein [Streptomyces albipurpureus]|uniref:Uncharacterized protein n=1 Tax=Streptomyces albipurpureus TaxID=2897419 RepID=A0ABT0UTM6_9ACTN|nr:hypothetical protein [Streptomyces sp. CWNU-1]MCM2391799.1 hypothetical protein [Streptomyces sp. CWNU-1]